VAVTVYVLWLVVDDFKPASIDTDQPAVIDIEQGNKVKVTVPHVEVGINFLQLDYIHFSEVFIKTSVT